MPRMTCSLIQELNMARLLCLLLLSIGLAVVNAEENPYIACSISGDPHIRSFDKVRWHYQGQGWFEIFRHKTDGLTLQIDSLFELCWANGKNDGPTCLEKTAVHIFYGDVHTRLSWSVGDKLEMAPQGTFDSNSADVYTLDDKKTTIQQKNSKLYIVHEDAVQGFRITIGKHLLVVAMRDSEEFINVKGVCQKVSVNAHPDRRNFDSLYQEHNVTSGNNLRGPQIDLFGDSKALADGRSEILVKMDIRKYVPRINHHASANMIEVEESLDKTMVQKLVQAATPGCKDQSGNDAEVFTDCVYDVKVMCSDKDVSEMENCIKVNSTATVEAAKIVRDMESLTTGEALSITAAVFIVIGVVAVLGVSAYFLINPEKLPFNLKKKKIATELQDYAVLDEHTDMTRLPEPMRDNVL